MCIRDSTSASHASSAARSTYGPAGPAAEPPPLTNTLSNSTPPCAVAPSLPPAPPAPGPRPRLARSGTSAVPLLSLLGGCAASMARAAAGSSDVTRKTTDVAPCAARPVRPQTGKHTRVSRRE
eukprot:6190764-Prymnesium_polylepis.1